MSRTGKNKPKTISLRLKEIQQFIGASDDDMIYLLGMKEQMYRMYLSGKFDNTYSIKQERVLGRVVYLDEEIQKRIDTLKLLRGRFENYGKVNGKSKTVKR